MLKRFEPTHRDLALVSSETAKRTTELRRLIRSLNLVTRELGAKDDDLAQLVDSASKSFGTLANRREEVSGTVRRLPGTLAQATRALNRVEGMARVLRPAAQELRAVPPALIESNREVRPFALEAAPLLRSDIRPFARAAAPAVGELAKSAPDLAASEPGLQRTFKALNTLGNMAGNNPRGRESQDTPVATRASSSTRPGATTSSARSLHGPTRRARRARSSTARLAGTGRSSRGHIRRRASVWPSTSSSTALR